MKKEKSYIHFENGDIKDKSTYYTFTELVENISDEEMEQYKGKSRVEIVLHYIEKGFFVEVE